MVVSYGGNSRVRVNVGARWIVRMKATGKASPKPRARNVILREAVVISPTKIVKRKHPREASRECTFLRGTTLQRTYLQP